MREAAAESGFFSLVFRKASWETLLSGPGMKGRPEAYFYSLPAWTHPITAPSLCLSVSLSLSPPPPPPPPTAHAHVCVSLCLHLPATGAHCTRFFFSPCSLSLSFSNTHSALSHTCPKQHLESKQKRVVSLKNPARVRRMMTPAAYRHSEPLPPTLGLEERQGTGMWHELQREAERTEKPRQHK